MAWLRRKNKKGLIIDLDLVAPHLSRPEGPLPQRAIQVKIIPSQELETTSSGGGQDPGHRGELSPRIWFEVTNSRLPGSKEINGL